MLVLLCLTVNVFAQSRRGNTNGYRQGNTYYQRRGTTTGESILSRLQKQAQKAQEDATRQSTEKRNKNKTKNSTNNQQQEMETVVTSSNNVATADHPQSQNREKEKDDMETVVTSSNNAATADHPQNQTREKEKDDVVLVVSGDGPNKEEATKNALRSAIEQAFGTFVSANTEILNDELIKDEIATVASGNIKTYKEIATTILPNGLCSVTISATVSTGKLVSYVQAHGGSAEFAGQTFMMEMKMRELNKENEIKAIEHLISLVRESKELFDYKVMLQTPIESDISVDWAALDNNLRRDYKTTYYGYLLPIQIVYSTNDNYKTLIESVLATLSTLSLSQTEQKQYDETQSKYYRYEFGWNKSPESFLFRSTKCSKLFQILDNHLTNNVKNFSVKFSGCDMDLNFNKIYPVRGEQLAWYDPNTKNIVRNDPLFLRSRYTLYYLPKDSTSTLITDEDGKQIIGFPITSKKRVVEHFTESILVIRLTKRYGSYFLGDEINSEQYNIKVFAFGRYKTDEFYVFLSKEELYRLTGATITPNPTIAPISSSSAAPRAKATIPSHQPAHTYSSEEVQRIKDNAVAYRLAAQTPSFNGGDINKLLSWVQQANTLRYCKGIPWNALSPAMDI